MQLDMHYWAVYALARATGIPLEIARIIAHASQYVDDAKHTEMIIIGDKAIVPIMTAHKPIDFKILQTKDNLLVWPPFHFLPGNLETKIFMARMRCVANGPLIKPMLAHALQYQNHNRPFSPHLVGIATHVLLDSFAHDGFIGLSSELNKIKNTSLRIEVRSDAIKKYVWRKFKSFMAKTVRNTIEIIKGTVAEIIPIGHAALATLPDRPYLKLSYETEDGRKVERDNVESFWQACECLYNFLIEFAKDNPLCEDSTTSVPWDSISDRIRGILKKEGPLEDRIEEWRGVISSGDLFPVTEEDREANYFHKTWYPDRIPLLLAQGKTPDTCNPCLFIKAADIHRGYLLQKLFPEKELTIC